MAGKRIGSYLVDSSAVEGQNHTFRTKIIDRGRDVEEGGYAYPDVAMSRYCPSCHRMNHSPLFSKTVNSVSVTDFDFSDVECQHCEKVFEVRLFLSDPPPSQL